VIQQTEISAAEGVDFDDIAELQGKSWIVINDGKRAFECEHKPAIGAFRDPRWPHGRERKDPPCGERYGRQIVESMKQKSNRNTAMMKADASDYETQAVLVVGTGDGVIFILDMTTGSQSRFNRHQKRVADHRKNLDFWWPSSFDLTLELDAQTTNRVEGFCGILKVRLQHMRVRLADVAQEIRSFAATAAQRLFMKIDTEVYLTRIRDASQEVSVSTAA
jgi:hypothetical protein